MSTLAPPQPILACRVYGHPAPQGSKRHVGRGIMVESSKHVKPWREAVKAAALTAEHRPVGIIDDAIDLVVVFLLARPKSHYRTGRNAHLLRDAAPRRPVAKPDLDKLVRSTMDALKDAGVYRDDSQVVGIESRKRYAYTDETPGAHIEVWRTAEASGDPT